MFYFFEILKTPAKNKGRTNLQFRKVADAKLSQRNQSHFYTLTNEITDKEIKQSYNNIKNNIILNSQSNPEQKKEKIKSLRHHFS